MILSKLLHQQIDQAKTRKQLSVLLRDIGDLTTERPWLVGHIASRSHELSGRGGFRIASDEMNKGPGRPVGARAALGVSSRTWELFKDLREDYPDISFSVYRLLYCYGVPIEEAPEWLKYASELTVKEFWNLIDLSSKKPMPKSKGGDN